MVQDSFVRACLIKQYKPRKCDPKGQIHKETAGE